MRAARKLPPHAGSCEEAITFRAHSDLRPDALFWVMWRHRSRSPTIPLRCRPALSNVARLRWQRTAAAGITMSVAGPRMASLASQFGILCFAASSVHAEHATDPRPFLCASGYPCAPSLRFRAGQPLLSSFRKSLRTTSERGRRGNRGRGGSNDGHNAQTRQCGRKEKGEKTK